MNLKIFKAWCQAKGIQSSLQIHESAPGIRYTTLREEIDSFSYVDEDADRRVNLVRVPLQAGVCLVADDSESLVDRLQFELNLGESSEYAPYLDTFPRFENFCHLPRFWSDRRLGSATLDGGQLERALETDRLRYRGQDPWALACVDTRCHFLPDGRYCLTPVLDMINHQPAIPTHLRVTHDDKVTSMNQGSQIINLDISVQHDSETVSGMRKDQENMLLNWWRYPFTQPSKRKPEIFISYGEFSNVQSLLQYGFLVPDNPHNIEVLVVRVLQQTSPIFLTIRADGSIDDRDLGRIRMAFASTMEKDLLQAIAFRGPPIDTSPLFLSHRNEDEVMGFVAAELEIAIEKAIEGSELCKDDALVCLYLKERGRTLQKALAWVLLKIR
jgi:hypothetical protein